jgi:hypothetical protein
MIDTNTPAINAQPVELDGIPTSPEELKRRETGGSTSGGGFISPADGEDIDAEFLGEGGKGAGQIGREVWYSISNTCTNKADVGIETRCDISFAV